MASGAIARETETAMTDDDLKAWRIENGFVENPSTESTVFFLRSPEAAAAMRSADREARGGGSDRRGRTAERRL